MAFVVGRVAFVVGRVAFVVGRVAFHFSPSIVSV